MWDTYRSRMNVTGLTPRERNLNRVQSWLSRKLPESLSYHPMIIDGEPRSAAVKNSAEDLSMKTIYSMPGETLTNGSLVEYDDTYWLITAVDPEQEVYGKGTLQRCNHKLKWINDEGIIIERWSIVIDGTKYLIGEKEQEVMTVGDSRMAVTVAKDDETSKLKRGMRFLIGDYTTNNYLAYQITKPNLLFNMYDGEGVFRYIMNETEITANDNLEEGIADYYNWTPPVVTDGDHVDTEVDFDEMIQEAKEASELPKDDNKGVWL